jgi:hypothetical protein
MDLDNERCLSRLEENSNECEIILLKVAKCKQISILTLVQDTK